MPDRVLTGENLDAMEHQAELDAGIKGCYAWSDEDITAVIASHRLQAARIQELEERIYFLKLGDKEDD